MKNLFQSWNKTFANDKSLKNHQRSKYCSKNNKTKEYWAQKEEEFRREETREFLDNNTIDTISDIKRAPYGVLEECRSDNLEELNIDELQDVMVNLEESDIFYNKFMYNIINPVENPVATRIFENMDEIIEPDFIGNVNEDQFVYPLDSLNQSRYLKFQRDLYSITFGIESLNALDFREMISIIKSTYHNKFKGGFLQNVALYDYWTKYRVSRDQRQDMLNLMRNVLFPGAKSSHIRKSVNGIRYKVEKCLKTYTMFPLQIKWPAGWKIDTMKGMQLSPIMIYLRDPIELIAEVFVNPEIMFKHRDHVKFDYYVKQNSQYGDLMCSEWCRLTESYVRETKIILD